MSEWPVKTLDKCCDVEMGQSPKGDTYNTDGLGVPLINGPVEFGIGAFGTTVASKFTTQPTKLCKAGDLILCVRGSTTGKMNIAGQDSCIGRGVAAIRAHESQDWINHYINFKRQEIYELGSGSTFPNVSGAILKKIPIPVPPLAEQERIVAILDEAFEGLATATAHTERKLQNARALFQSTLQSTFQHKGENWTEKKLSEIADSCLGKMLDKRKNKGTLKPYLRNKSVRWFGFDLEDITRMRFEESELERYSAKKGDVLICEGGYPGRAAIWDFDEPIFFQKAVHRVRFHDPIYNKWLVYLLYHKDSIGELSDHFTGSGIQHFTGKALGNFPIPHGPSNEVRSLVEKLDELSAQTRQLEALYQRQLDAYTELKQSLLHQAFSGKL